MEVKVDEDVPECETASTITCTNDPATGEEVCKDWPRQVGISKYTVARCVKYGKVCFNLLNKNFKLCQVCNVVVKKKQAKRVPETSCSHIPRKVCGPALCPLVKKDPICEDRVKMVILLLSKGQIKPKICTAHVVKIFIY